MSYTLKKGSVIEVNLFNGETKKFTIKEGEWLVTFDHDTFIATEVATETIRVMAPKQTVVVINKK